MGLLKAVWDAIFASDNQIGGRYVTLLTAQLSDTEVASLSVEATQGFGEFTDGANDCRLLIGGEVISGTGRTATTFTGLTRGIGLSKVKTHPPGTLVYDMSRNVSAIDRVWRGLLVNYAVGEDLDVVGRNLGLYKCRSITEAQWRAIIKAVAYLPKQTIDAFNRAMEALLGAGNFQVRERIITDPWKVFIEVDTVLSTSLRGRFVLNGGTPALTTGALTVDTPYPINNVIGVYDDNALTRRGFRDGTNYYMPGGSFLGSTITLDSSPGIAGTPVIIDYGAHEAHYLADDETVLDDGDFYAYLSDPLLAPKCLAEQIRAAGTEAVVTARY